MNKFKIENLTEKEVEELDTDLDIINIIKNRGCVNDDVTFYLHKKNERPDGSIPLIVNLQGSISNLAKTIGNLLANDENIQEAFMLGIMYHIGTSPNRIEKFEKLLQSLKDYKHE